MGGKARWVSPLCTMDRIANMMVNQLNAPVTDATGLTGKYDVNMFWEAGGFSNGVLRAAPAGAEPAASELDGADYLHRASRSTGPEATVEEVVDRSLGGRSPGKVPTEN
jgi:uncharacterized protein (TIGR03435 family)